MRARDRFALFVAAYAAGLLAWVRPDAFMLGSLAAVAAVVAGGFGLVLLWGKGNAGARVRRAEALRRGAPAVAGLACFAVSCVAAAALARRDGWQAVYLACGLGLVLGLVAVRSAWAKAA